MRCCGGGFIAAKQCAVIGEVKNARVGDIYE